MLGTEDLIVNHDRYGMFRPAKEHPERATMTNLHLDMNPWNYIEGRVRDTSELLVLNLHSQIS